jgi:hypothetical protein
VRDVVQFVDVDVEALVLLELFPPELPIDHVFFLSLGILLFGDDVLDPQPRYERERRVDVREGETLPPSHHGDGGQSFSRTNIPDQCADYFNPSSDFPSFMMCASSCSRSLSAMRWNLAASILAS